MINWLWRVRERNVKEDFQVFVLYIWMNGCVFIKVGTFGGEIGLGEYYEFSFRNVQV